MSKNFKHLAKAKTVFFFVPPIVHISKTSYLYHKHKKNNKSLQSRCLEKQIWQWQWNYLLINKIANLFILFSFSIAWFAIPALKGGEGWMGLCSAANFQTGDQSLRPVTARQLMFTIFP